MSHICCGLSLHHACLLACTSSLPACDLVPLPLSVCGLFSYASPSSSSSQYALVYKGFSLLQDDLLYWQLPSQFTGDKVTLKIQGDVLP